MRLTGAPLISLTLAAAVAIAAATFWLWPRGRRLRPVIRTAGVLLLETATVLTAGLVVNRHEQFYPSWKALRGDTGTVAVISEVHAGSLDARRPAGTFSWHPPGLGAWHLAGPPTVTVPADYPNRPGVRFPVVLDLGGPARRTPEAVTVTVTPTARTTASALHTLPGELGRDLRITGTGWDVRGGGPLGAAFVRAAPAGSAVLDRPADTLPPPLAAPERLPS